MTEITVYKNFWDANPKYVDIDYTLDKIRDGALKSQIDAIRSETDKEKKRSLKNSLPCILFSGKFSERKDAAIIEHSGVICLDFDKFKDRETLMSFKEELKKDRFVMSVFESPSSDGLKVLVKTTKEASNHRGHFRALKRHFNHPNWDNSCINESRICFMSYDPDIYINRHPKTFRDVDEDTRPSLLDNQPIQRSEDEIVNGLYKWWSSRYPMMEGQRNRNAFILAATMNEFGVPEMSALNFLSQFETEGFDGREIKSCVESAYKKTHLHNTKTFNDKTEDTYVYEDSVKAPSATRANMAEIYKNSFVDVKKPIIRQPIALSIGSHVFKGKSYDTSFGTFGNFSVIVGAAKSRKSFFKTMLLSSFIGGQSNIYCGSMKTHRERDMFILDIDTEQSEFDSQRAFKRAMEMVGVENYEYYKPFALRPYTPAERLEFVEWLIYESDFRDNIGFMALDGIADLCNDFNDIKESSALISKIMKWTDDFQFHLTTVLHTNFGSVKPTGHLGSSVLKKAETICLVEKVDPETSSVTFPYTRSMGIDDLKFNIIDGIPTVINPLTDIKPMPVNKSFYEVDTDDPPF